MYTRDIRRGVTWYPWSTLDWHLDQHPINILINTQSTKIAWHLDRHSVYTQLTFGRVLIDSYEHGIDQHLMVCMWKFINWDADQVLTKYQWGYRLTVDWDVDAVYQRWFKYTLSEFERYRGLIVSTPNSDPCSGPYSITGYGPTAVNGSPVTLLWFHKSVNQFSTCLLLILLTTLPASSSGSEGLGTL